MLNKLLMSDDTLLTLFFVVPLSIAAVVIVLYFIFQYPKDKAKIEARKQAFYDECEKEPEYVFKKAQVLSKYKDAYYKPELRMIEVPAYKEEYYVNFITEDGTETGYQVSKEMYDKIEEDQIGTLVTVNGNFFDFGDGVDIEADEEASPEILEEQENIKE